MRFDSNSSGNWGKNHHRTGSNWEYNLSKHPSNREKRRFSLLVYLISRHKLLVV